MDYNAFVLDWTMNDFPQFKARLDEARFSWITKPDSHHLHVSVPYAGYQAFAVICREHLNAPFNYVDIQYPDERQTILVFQQKTFVISTPQENEQARHWAIAEGLPVEQADWGTSFGS